MNSPTQEAEFKSALLALSGRLLAGEIDDELLEVLRSPGVAEVFEDIEPNCLEIDLEEAGAEYRRLFVLPEGAAPLASAWLPSSDSGKVAGIVALVEDIEATLGLDLPDELPLDHAGVLLPLMGWMVENQPNSVPEFFETALAPWLSTFAKALENNARLPIYRATAKILASGTV